MEKWYQKITKGKAAIAVLILAVLFVAVAFFSSNVDNMSQGNKYIQDFSDGWSAIIDGETYEVSIPVLKKDQMSSPVCVFEHKIPTSMWGKTILLYTINGNFKVYFGKQFAYQYAVKDTKLFGEGTGKVWHLIDIPEELGDSYIRIEMSAPEDDAESCITGAYVGSRASCILQINDSSRTATLEIYLIFIMFCCVTIIVLAQRYNGVEVKNLVYGMPYMGVIFLYYITKLDTSQFYFGNQYICYIVNSVAYLFIPVFLMCLFGEHLKSCGRRLYNVLYIIAIAGIPVVLLLQFFDISELYVTKGYAGILNIVCVALLLISYIKGFKGSKAKIYSGMMIGAITFYLVSLLLNIRDGFNYGNVVASSLVLHAVTVFVAAVTGIEYERFNRELSMRENIRNLTRIQHATISNLAEMIESRDEVTGFHVKNTVKFVEIIVEGMMEKGYYKDVLTPQEAKRIIEAAPLHDVGKIAISDTILLAPRKLTEEEFNIIKTHTVHGGRIVQKILADFGDDEYTRTAMEISTWHHERWDGRGYPDGLKEEEIPISACIMAVADVFDALISKRPYKDPFDTMKAIEIIKSESGTHFNPKVVEVFCEKQEEILKAVMQEKVL